MAGDSLDGIDWDFWSAMPDVKLWQAVFLSCGIDPDKHDPEYAAFDDFIAENEAVSKRLRLLAANIGDRQFFTPGVLSLSDPNFHGVRLCEVAAWALSLSKPWEMPPEMATIAMASQPPGPTPEPVTSSTERVANPHPAGSWKFEAWKIGKEWMLDQKRETGTTPGVVSIAQYVDGELSNREIKGARGKFLDWETIKREALTGITQRKRNGKK